MKHPLIYTELRWLPRLLDILLTLLAWGGFLWLIYRGVVLALHQNSYFGTSTVLGTFGSILGYLLLIVIGSLVLISWAKYNQYRYRHERRQRRAELTPEELAESLEVDKQTMSRASMARNQVLHHASDGSIERVEVLY